MEDVEKETEEEEEVEEEGRARGAAFEVPAETLNQQSAANRFAARMDALAALPVHPAPAASSLLSGGFSWFTSAVTSAAEVVRTAVVAAAAAKEAEDAEEAEEAEEAPRAAGAPGLSPSAVGGKGKESPGGVANAAEGWGEEEDLFDE